jgi:membrane-bound metal-dependent hydrolase YbcI (DUF457 family)
MCTQATEETLKHLFFECEFAQMCWSGLNIIWGLSLPVVEMIEDGHRHFMHSCYMEVVVLVAGTIWIHRNNSIFNGLQVSLAR